MLTPATGVATTNGQVVTLSTDSFVTYIPAGQVSGGTNSITFAGTLVAGQVYVIRNASVSTNGLYIPKSGYWKTDATLLAVDEVIFAIASATNALHGEKQ